MEIFVWTRENEMEIDECKSLFSLYSVNGEKEISEMLQMYA